MVGDLIEEKRYGDYQNAVTANGSAHTINKYNPDANVMIEHPRAHIKGPLSIYADTLTFESTQLPGTYNTIVRNRSIVLTK